MPPKDDEKKTKEAGKYTYNWCKHHMAQTVHKPSDCKLGKKHKDNQKKGNNNNANSTVIASVATTLNSRYAALLATLANLDNKE